MISVDYGEGFESYVANKIINSGFLVVTDIILKTGKDICQVDCLVVCRGVVFVIECKDLNCLISKMDIEDKYWLLNYKHEVIPYYNPIKQNAKHCRVLSDVLGKNNYTYYNIIILSDKARMTQEIGTVMYVDKFLQLLEKIRRQVDVTDIKLYNNLKLVKRQNLLLEGELRSNVMKIRKGAKKK